jgi:hypothetical protein
MALDYMRTRLGPSELAPGRTMLEGQ